MEAAAELTIDQLAQRTGMSARNIRAHQSRGLLAPPRLRGRTGYYGDSHVERVELIQKLQADGFSLALIDRLLRIAGDSTESLARLADALDQRSEAENSHVGATEALERRFRTRSVERTSLGQLGFLGEVENGQVEEVTRLAIRGTEVFADLGVPAEDLAIVAAELRRQLDDVASAFLRLFVDHVWKPFERAGEREKAMDELLQAVERLRPVGSAVAGSLFQVAMSEALEQRFGSELKQLELQRSG